MLLRSSTLQCNYALKRTPFIGLSAGSTYHIRKFYLDKTESDRKKTGASRLNDSSKTGHNRLKNQFQARGGGVVAAAC